MVGSPERNQRFSTTMFFQLIFLVVRSGKPLVHPDHRVHVEGGDGVHPGAVRAPGPGLEDPADGVEVDLQITEPSASMNASQSCSSL